MAISKLGKKGMFITFISIAIIAAIIMILTPSKINLNENISVIKTRVENVNGYVEDLEIVYLENTLQATGRKTIIALIGYVENQGFFSDKTEFESAFSEVLLNGTFGGPTSPIGNFIDPAYMDQDIMVDNTYTDWFNAIKTTAKNTHNVDTSYWVIVDDIRIDQTNPWFVDVEADITFSVTSETASWTRDTTIKTEISVEKFDDPYYLANTHPNYENKIRKSGTKFDEWNVNKVKDFITDGNYTHFQNSNAPNFLMRFYNDISASSCCGIESLVDPNDLDNLGLDNDRDVSYADYLFWSDTEDCDIPPKNLFKVNGIDTKLPNFKFDFNHLAKYKLSANKQLCPPP